MTLSKQENADQRSGLRLETIPFCETMPEEPPAPPARAIYGPVGDQRTAARRYWITHPVDGLLNTVFHELLARLPARFVSAFGHATADLARLRYRNRIFAQRIERNFYALTSSLGRNDQEQQDGLKRWWRNIGRTMAEFSKANHLWRGDHLQVQGSENLERAQELGKPLIFVSMHLGTWEAAFTAIHERLATPSIGPFQPEPNRFTNRIVYRLRKRRNQYLFPPGQRSAIRLHKLLRSGATSLTIFIDEVRDNQVHMPTFGRPLPDKGNAVVAIKLANAAGGTIVPFYLRRQNGPDFDLNILPPLEPNTADQTKRYDMKPTLQAFNDIFEPIVLDNIEHWYMLSELRLAPNFKRTLGEKHPTALS
ncbi:lysophospholipid acyltransferase family protein [Labrenzia sp. CE80]|uniref:lysophospholipid acyltransferase family protein n=1 Tax=Labrenzia sp. CE80 TaxID=1788986 RepID=UPI00129A959E|nr:lysophospholipid acyltransferase family protein [Labrenzia sp. CE80]